MSWPCAWFAWKTIAMHNLFPSLSSHALATGMSHAHVTCYMLQHVTCVVWIHVTCVSMHMDLSCMVSSCHVSVHVHMNMWFTCHSHMHEHLHAMYVMSWRSCDAYAMTSHMQWHVWQLFSHGFCIEAQSILHFMPPRSPKLCKSFLC